MRQRSGPRPAAFALCPTGTGALLRRDAQTRGMNPRAVTNDGRADLVPLAPAAWEELPDLRGAETVCADLGTIRLRGSLRATTGQLHDARLEAALVSLRRRGLLPATAPLRLVVRLRTEDRFTRGQLRDAVARRLRSPVTRGHERAIEIWLIEHARGSLRVGVRLESLEPRRASRAAERPGSLRPAIAAAMIGLAGQTPGRLLDPCCGSGTLLAEAQIAGWSAAGGDSAVDAVSTAAANVVAGVARLDARRLPFRADEFDAVVSNLPFGHRYDVQGAPVAWYRRTLTEALRVAPRAVVLAPASPAFRQALGRMKAVLCERHPIEILGRAATIWVIDRDGEPAGRGGRVGPGRWSRSMISM